MTTVAEPTFNRQIISPLLSRLHEFASGNWIVPSGTTKLSEEAALHTQLTSGPYDGFAFSNTSSSGLQARFGTGEAFVGGRFLASDDSTMTDDVTSELVHAVDLPAGQTTTVYLGPDDRTNNAATDRLIIGRDDSGESDFPSETTPKTPLYNLTTDTDSITAVEDLRTTTQQISANATSSNDADSLAGQPPSSWARTDANDSFDGAIGIGDGAPQHPIGYSEDERIRLYDDGTTYNRDTYIQSVTGAGRMTIGYNAYFRNGQWSLGVGEDNASVIGMNSGDPGLGFGAIITLGGYDAGGAGSDGVDGENISWEWIGFDRGHVWTNGESMQSVPVRSDTPASSAIPYASAGMWVDPSAQTVNFVLDDGRTASLNLDDPF